MKFALRAFQANLCKHAIVFAFLDFFREPITLSGRVIDRAFRPSRGHAEASVSMISSRRVLTLFPHTLAALTWAATMALAVTATALEAATPVHTTQARSDRQQVEISLSGSVIASRRAQIASEIAGIVDRFNVRSGQRVRAGEPLAKLRTAPFELRIQAARADLAEAEARFRSSELRLTRLQELSGSEVVSRQSVDDSLFETQAISAQVERLRAELALLEDQLERSTIRAPFDGAIVEEFTQQGEWLDAGDPVVELIALDGLEIRLDLPETHRRLVRTGDKARFRLDSLGSAEIEGAVRAVVPNASSSARTFPVYLRPLESLGLGVGSTVKATLLLGDDSGAVWVPRDAILRRGERQVVFRLDENSVVRAVEVRRRSDRGQWLSIVGDVAAGDDLVIEGNESLQDGDLVSAESREYPWP